jgi:hypothetical protein
MSATFYHRMSESEKDKIDIRIRVEFKQFCCLPLNMANYRFNIIFGSTVRDYMEQTNTTIRDNLDRRLGITTFLTPRKFGISRNRNCKPLKFPKQLTEMLRKLYWTKCVSSIKARSLTQRTCAKHTSLTLTPNL